MNGLTSLAAEFVKIPVAVIAATGGEISARAAKAATSTIAARIHGRVRCGEGRACRIAQPTGRQCHRRQSAWAMTLDAKLIQLLHESVPRASTIGVLVQYPKSPALTELPNMKVASEANGQRLVVLEVD